MPLARKRKSIRQQVAERANFCCEYCRTTEEVSTSAFEVEHIEPTIREGADDLPNMAWSCRRCNSNKGIATTGIDPIDNQVVPLFHPRQHIWQEHFAWNQDDNTQILGKTSIGRVTIIELELNRPELILLRRLLKYEGLHPPSSANIP